MADTAACSSSRNRSAGLLSASNLAARTAQPGANLRQTAFSACRTLHPGRCQTSLRTKRLRKLPKRSCRPKERDGIFSNTGWILVHVFQRRNPAGRVPADLSADAPLSASTVSIAFCLSKVEGGLFVCPSCPILSSARTGCMPPRTSSLLSAPLAVIPCHTPLRAQSVVGRWLFAIQERVNNPTLKDGACGKP